MNFNNHHSAIQIVSYEKKPRKIKKHKDGQNLDAEDSIFVLDLKRKDGEKEKKRLLAST